MRFRVTVFFVPFFTISTGEPASATQRSLDSWIPGALRVKLATSVADDADALGRVSSIASAQQVELVAARRAFPGPRHPALKREFGLDRWIALEVPAGLDLADQLRRWRAHPDVEAAERVSRPVPVATPNDSLYAQQWEHDNTGANPTVPPGTPDADMDTAEAWDLVSGDQLAVHFESVHWFHEDLVGRVWENLGEDLDADGVLEWDSVQVRYVFDPDDINGIDDDGSGYADDLVGWNFAENNRFPDAGPSGHGTATAGFLLAEPNNGIGVAGACQDCRLIAVKGDVPTGLVYAADLGAGIASLSNLDSYSQAFQDALDYAVALGVVFVTSAGNDEIIEVNPLCSDPNVLCVSATDPRDRIVTSETTGGIWGTSFGPLTDVGAPGINLTYLAESGYDNPGSGTSFAAPNAAGVVALVKSANPALTPPEVISIVQSTTDPVVDPDRFAGLGRVNAKSAVDEALAAAAFGSYPVALLGPLPAIDLYGQMRIFGTASSTDFDRYRIRVGIGLEPGSWILDHEILAPVTEGVLASLDVSSYARMTDFRIELTVDDTNGQRAVDAMHPVLKLNTFAEIAPWPLTNADTYGSPTFGDLTGDGGLEILVKTGDDYHAFHRSGALLPDWPITNLVGQWVPPAFFDVDSDDAQELLTPHEAAPGTHRLFAYRDDASFPSGWPQTLPFNSYQYPLIGDLDGDGNDEIVQCTWFPQPLPTIHVFRPDGTPLPGWPVALPFDLNRAPVLADPDGDGDVDLLLRVTGNLHLIDETGSAIPGWPLGDFATLEPVAGDLDGDGADEIVRGRLSQIFVNDGDGSVRAGWPQGVDSDVAKLALGDVDGDGNPEIVATVASENVYVFNEDGTSAAGPWPIFFDPLFVFQALANVDADPELEILYSARGAVHAVDGNGSPLPQWPLTIEGLVLDAVPADYDGDGSLELFVNCDPGIPGTRGALHLFDLWESSAADDWVLEHRDPTNSRRYVCTTQATSAPGHALDPGSFALLPPRPNPSFAGVSFDWVVPEPSRISLRVFDVSGRLVETLVERQLEPGRHTVTWDGRDRGGRPSASGVYFVRLSAPGFSAVQRFVEIRR